MSKKNGFALKLALVIALAACLGIGGMLAYFISKDTATNEFTIGSVSLEIQEEEGEGTDLSNVTPNQELVKDPLVYNDGANAEYVFAAVSVPYASVKTAAQDGTVSDEAANTELFTLLDSSNAEGTNAGWYLMGYLDDDEAVSADKAYREDGTVVWLYAYGSASEMTALGAGDKTASIFSKIRFVNLVEGQTLTETDICLNAYGIQSTNLNDSVGGGNADGKNSPAEVWQIVGNASASSGG